MNNWQLSNVYWKHWQNAVQYAKQYQYTNQHYCRQAMLANMNYVCYLAQEWAGARK